MGEIKKYQSFEKGGASLVFRKEGKSEIGSSFCANTFLGYFRTIFVYFEDNGMYKQY